MTFHSIELYWFKTYREIGGSRELYEFANRGEAIVVEKKYETRKYFCINLLGVVSGAKELIHLP